jgi:hypothetical protein
MYAIVFINIFDKKNACIKSIRNSLYDAKTELAYNIEVNYSNLNLYKYVASIWSDDNEDETTYKNNENIYCF